MLIAKSLPRTSFGVCILLAIGCQQQMADQPTAGSLEPSRFFDDGLSARPLLTGTLARGHLQLDTALYYGRTRLAAEMTDGTRPVDAEVANRFDHTRDFVNDFPIPINESVIRYGRQRYMIYCVVCHDTLGTGHGKIVERVMRRRRLITLSGFVIVQWVDCLLS